MTDLMPELAALDEPSLCIHDADRTKMVIKSKQFTKDSPFGRTIITAPCGKCGSMLRYELDDDDAKFGAAPRLVKVTPP